ncbi:MAG: ComEC/Rec2 family competence protein [Patescibacteria group bacterium]
MVDNYKKHGLVLMVLVLIFCNSIIFYIDFKYSNRKLTFVMMNVGQGDALFIESPTGTQIIVDGGPGKNILKELPKFMPFWDRSIDAVVITNPDKDHISGFTDILKLYKVDTVFEPGTMNDSSTYKNLEKEIKNQDIPNILAKKGMIIDIGGGAYLEVLFPDRDVSMREVNDGSIVMRLIYGETSIMLTGDATLKTEKIILNNEKENSLQSDILKVGHHGSRTSSSYEFVKEVKPKYAVISDGVNNSYGHPHPETLRTLNELGVEILRTDELGTIIFSCDRMGTCEIHK